MLVFILRPIRHRNEAGPLATRATSVRARSCGCLRLSDECQASTSLSTLSGASTWSSDRPGALCIHDQTATDNLRLGRLIR